MACRATAIGGCAGRVRAAQQPRVDAHDSEVHICDSRFGCSGSGLPDRYGLGSPFKAWVFVLGEGLEQGGTDLRLG